MNRKDVKEKLYWAITVIYVDATEDTYYSPRVDKVAAVNGMVSILANERIKAFEVYPYDEDIDESI